MPKNQPNRLLQAALSVRPRRTTNNFLTESRVTHVGNVVGAVIGQENVRLRADPELRHKGLVQKQLHPNQRQVFFHRAVGRRLMFMSTSSTKERRIALFLILVVIYLFWAVKFYRNCCIKHARPISMRQTPPLCRFWEVQLWRFQIAGMMTEYEFLVSDAVEEIILGADLLMHNMCFWDFEASTLQVRGILDCCNVLLKTAIY
jgi:hypothetical protein